MANRMCVLLSCDSSCSVMTSLGNNLLDGLLSKHWLLCFLRNVFFLYFLGGFLCLFLKGTSGCNPNALLISNQDAHLFPAILTTCIFFHLWVIDG